MLPVHKHFYCLLKFETKLISVLERKNKAMAIPAFYVLPPGLWDADGGLEEGIVDLYKRDHRERCSRGWVSRPPLVISVDLFDAHTRDQTVYKGRSVFT